MTLKQLNDIITGYSERCYMIYSDTTYSKKIGEIWTEVSDGRGGYFEKWDDDPIINREVIAFRTSGWQSDVYDVVLK
jgi:hypothetical protein